MRDRRASAVRLVVHRLLAAPDPGEARRLETALALLDGRLVSGADARRKAAEEAVRLYEGLLPHRAPGRALHGEVRRHVRIGVHWRRGGRRRVVVPTLVTSETGAPVVLEVAPEGDLGARRRLNTYRAAARLLLRRPVEAFLHREGGGLERLPDAGTDAESKTDPKERPGADDPQAANV